MEYGATVADGLLGGGGPDCIGGTADAGGAFALNSVGGSAGGVGTGFGGLGCSGTGFGGL